MALRKQTTGGGGRQDLENLDDDPEGTSPGAALPCAGMLLRPRNKLGLVEEDCAAALGGPLASD